MNAIISSAICFERSSIHDVYYKWQDDILDLLRELNELIKNHRNYNSTIEPLNKWVEIKEKIKDTTLSYFTIKQCNLSLLARDLQFISILLELEFDNIVVINKLDSIKYPNYYLGSDRMNGEIKFIIIMPSTIKEIEYYNIENRPKYIPNLYNSYMNAIRYREVYLHIYTVVLEYIDWIDLDESICNYKEIYNEKLKLDKFKETIIKAGKTIDNFHNLGFTHGNIDEKNIIFDGDDFFLIGFDRYKHFKDKENNKYKASKNDDWDDFKSIISTLYKFIGFSFRDYFLFFEIKSISDLQNLTEKCFYIDVWKSELKSDKKLNCSTTEIMINDFMPLINSLPHRHDMLILKRKVDSITISISDDLTFISNDSMSESNNFIQNFEQFVYDFNELIASSYDLTHISKLLKPIFNDIEWINIIEDVKKITMSSFTEKYCESFINEFSTLNSNFRKIKFYNKYGNKELFTKKVLKKYFNDLVILYLKQLKFLIELENDGIFVIERIKVNLYIGYLKIENSLIKCLIKSGCTSKELEYYKNEKKPPHTPALYKIYKDRYFSRNPENYSKLKEYNIIETTILIEFIPNRLVDWIKSKKLKLEDLMKLMIRIGEAIEKLHNAGFVHNYLYESSILLKETGEVILTNFYECEYFDSQKINNSMHQEGKRNDWEMFKDNIFFGDFTGLKNPGFKIKSLSDLQNLVRKYLLVDLEKIVSKKLRKLDNRTYQAKSNYSISEFNYLPGERKYISELGEKLDSIRITISNDLIPKSNDFDESFEKFKSYFKELIISSNDLRYISEALKPIYDDKEWIETISGFEGITKSPITKKFCDDFINEFSTLNSNFKMIRLCEKLRMNGKRVTNEIIKKYFDDLINLWVKQMKFMVKLENDGIIVTKLGESSSHRYTYEGWFIRDNSLEKCIIEPYCGNDELESLRNKSLETNGSVIIYENNYLCENVESYLNLSQGDHVPVYNTAVIVIENLSND